MADEELKLKVGRTYRGKRPQNRSGLVNDRTILHIGATHIQYDGPVVGFGRHYPSCTREAFLQWAARDVTDELPKGEYAEWPIKN
ncbi:hypothetical protein M9319_004091 [Salmonella enterica]|uniref:Uncharacterized protein n=1 Tax=Salmonella phage PMBT19 TaxID=3229743 RepID=A0AB39C155_9CAUD|nr:hypothetical protein [Salmonella enterica]EJG3787263.1 hypothetical protein [Salmonella enterica]